MLPLSHIYVSTKVTGRKNANLLSGSVIPDISLTSSGYISKENFHNTPKKFYKFVKNNYPKSIDFALGVSLHSYVGRGADYYCDHKKIGYAKIMGRKISSEVADLLEISNGPISLSYAHNIIEGCVDYYLSVNDPYLVNLFQKSIDNSPNIIPIIAKYLNINEILVQNDVKKYFSFMNPDNYISRESLFYNVFIPLAKILFKKEINPNQANSIINKALSLTKDTYQEYLDRVVDQLKINFKNII